MIVKWCGICFRYMEALPWLNMAYQMNDRLRETERVSSSFVALDARILAYYRRQCLLVRMWCIRRVHSTKCKWKWCVPFIVTTYFTAFVVKHMTFGSFISSFSLCLLVTVTTVTLFLFVSPCHMCWTVHELVFGQLLLLLNRLVTTWCFLLCVIQLYIKASL